MGKANVLLVEDDPVQANVTKEILVKAGYNVLWAKDGVNAIKLVKTEKPDIILLDLVLPGLDGHEVCRWLKLEESTRGIPVIMLTVKKELSDKISGLQVGADDYLPKPYNELELNARIYASLRTKALQDELKMKNTQLEELLTKVEYMAITDALTGLYNRRRFHEVLDNEFERSKRFSSPFSTVMLDIDHFKKVNDNYGHLVGDSVLRDLAGIMQKSIRDIDTAARFGGEEFIILAPNTSPGDVVTVAERIRIITEGTHFEGLNNNALTVSIGISGLPDEFIENQDDLLKCSDIALYRAKQNGRNRIEITTGQELQKV